MRQNQQSMPHLIQTEKFFKIFTSLDFFFLKNLHANAKKSNLFAERLSLTFDFIGYLNDFLGRNPLKNHLNQPKNVKFP